MSTPNSTQGSSPRTDVYETTPRSDSSSTQEVGNPGIAKRVMMISTPGSSHGITPRTILPSAQKEDASQDQRLEEQKEATMGELSSSMSSDFKVSIEVKKSSSSDSSRKTTSSGEVEEHEESSTLLNDDKFLAANLESVLDAFEIFDTREREEIQKSLSDEPESSEAFEAVEKVAHVAQSSLKRLQRVVKEKDELIVALQEAVASAYRDAMAQQERDNKGLEQLHHMLLSREGLKLLDLRDSLQQLERENGLAGQLAKLFDQYLHDLSMQHEDPNKALEMDLASWKIRCEELETSLEYEKERWQAHLSNKLAETNLLSLDEELKNLRDGGAMCKSNQVLDWERAKDELQITHDMLEKLKDQLEQKDEQLRIYRESVDTLESLLDEEKERQTELANGYEEITKDTRQTLSKVSAVNKQLRVLKTDTSKYQMQGHTSDLEVKELQKKLEHQNVVNHKLGVELAAHRRRLSTRSKENDCKGCERLMDMQKQVQLLRDCVLALVAQVLELKNRPFVRGGKTLVSPKAKDTIDLNRDCNEECVPTSGQSASDPNIHCLHEFLPLSNTHDKGVSDIDSQFCSNQLCTTHSPEAQVKNALKLVESETIKKLEAHAKSTKKMEFLQRKLENCKQALDKSELQLGRSEAIVEHLKHELRKSQETNRELEAKMMKRVEKRKRNPTDCMRMKGLLDNIEQLEMECTLLKHEVLVQKDRRIARLERELQKARHGNSSILDNARRLEAKNDTEKVIAELESTIVSKDSLILELRFEVDQATWKLDQVQKRFDILFGALDCKKIERNPSLADSMLENIFSSENLNSPALNLLKEKVLARRGSFRSGSREKELEGLVEDLVKVVEKVSQDNEKLRWTCEDTIKHMEKNKELRRIVEDLQGQIAKGGQSPGKDKPNCAQATLIADLKSQLSDLAEVNAGLLRALRETEDQCSGLKQMVQEQFMQDSPSMPYQDREAFRKSKRICFSEDEHRKQDKRLQAQEKKITQLEQQVATQGQVIKDLKEQLESKESELDLVHGKLSIKMLNDQSESIEQNKNDMWSFSTPTTTFRDDKKRLPEDYFDTQYLVEHDYELTQAENHRLRKFVATLKNPELLHEIRDLKFDYDRMVKVCDRYEELLRIYSRQIGVPFNSLRGRISSTSMPREDTGENQVADVGGYY